MCKQHHRRRVTSTLVNETDYYGANDMDAACGGLEASGANGDDPARDGVDDFEDSGANDTVPTQDGPDGNDPASGGVDGRDTKTGDGGVDGGDAGSDGGGSSDVWEGYEHADDGAAITDLGARVEAALAATPVDPPTHRPSQCEPPWLW